MKKKISKAVGVVVAAGLMAGATQALAYEAGDIIVRAGYANVAPDESSDGIAVPALGIDPISGTEAEVDSGSALGLTVSYMLSSTLGIELLAATPFEHDITADLGSDGKVDAGSTKHLPPTLSVVWYPMGDGDSAIQPYLGAGLNYTTFFQEDVDGDLEALTGVLAGASGPVPLDLKLDDSWGIALQVGVDYAVNEKWHVNASVRWIDIETDAKFTNDDLGTVITVDNVEIDPMVYQLNIGYTF